MNKIKVHNVRPVNVKATPLDARKSVSLDGNNTQVALAEIAYALRMIAAKRFLMITSKHTVEAYDENNCLRTVPNLDWMGIFKTFQEANADYVQILSLRDENDIGERTAECFIYESPGVELTGPSIEGVEGLAGFVVEAMLQRDCGRLLIARNGSNVEYHYEDKDRKLVTTPVVHSFVEDLFRMMNERFYVESVYASVPKEFANRYEEMVEPSLKGAGHITKKEELFVPDGSKSFSAFSSHTESLMNFFMQL